MKMDERAFKAAFKVFYEVAKKTDNPWIEIIKETIEAYEKALWKPIEEAPKDGTEVLGGKSTWKTKAGHTVYGGIDIVKCIDDKTYNKIWIKRNGDQAFLTHWRHLPEFPESEGKPLGFEMPLPDTVLVGTVTHEERN